MNFIPTKYSSYVFIFLMTLFMGLILSGIFEVQAGTHFPEFIFSWLKRFLGTYVIVVPTVLIVSPIAKRIAPLLLKKEVNNKEIALEGYRCLALAHKTGNFEPYLKLLTDDYVFQIPVEPFREPRKGIAEARKFYETISSFRPNITFRPPVRVSAEASTVVIEFEDDGDIGGLKYFNRISASFDLREGKICGYREYFGYIDLPLLQKMSGS